MTTKITVPLDWDTVSVQYPLFLEFRRVLRVQSIRVLQPTRVHVKWKGIAGDEIRGRVISETFNLARRRGKERFKDFLFAVQLEPREEIGKGKTVDIGTCLGNEIEVMAVRHRSGRSHRWEILHHSLGWRCVAASKSSERSDAS